MSANALNSPQVVVDEVRLEANLRRMQDLANRAGTELWPHVKTHKMEAVGRRQLELGASGFTSAKLSEAEAMLGSGAGRLFLAHSLVGVEAINELCLLQNKLDELTIAVTSPAHCAALKPLLAATGRVFRVALAVDTGLGREGLRYRPEHAASLAEQIRASASMDLVALYTHEGHAYGQPPEALGEVADAVHQRLLAVRSEIGGALPLWPGCSVTAHLMVGRKAVQRIRPGAYVFGDLFLAEIAKVMAWDAIALTVETTVVDRPTPDLALIDAGSKVFSSDQHPAGLFARPRDGRRFAVTRLSEEHGFVTGEDVDALEIGERVAFVPAHVCPVVNLTDSVLVRGIDGSSRRWEVTARGCVL